MALPPNFLRGEPQPTEPAPMENFFPWMKQQLNSAVSQPLWPNGAPPQGQMSYNNAPRPDMGQLFQAQAMAPQGPAGRQQYLDQFYSMIYGPKQQPAVSQPTIPQPAQSAVAALPKIGPLNMYNSFLQQLLAKQGGQ